MRSLLRVWGYLVVTAGGERQARAYGEHLRLRRELGLLAGVREVLVVADPGWRRVGSVGSTLCCLARVIRERLDGSGKDMQTPEAWQEALGGLRVLIVHAGGDSRCLPTVLAARPSSRFRASAIAPSAQRFPTAGCRRTWPCPRDGG